MKTLTPHFEPSPTTIKRVVEYLDLLGLQVIGTRVDLETGRAYKSHTIYEADEVLQFRKLYRNHILQLPRKIPLSRRKVAG